MKADAGQTAVYKVNTTTRILHQYDTMLARLYTFCNVQQKEKPFRNFKMPKGRLTSLHEWGSRRKLANLIAVIQFAYKSPTHLSTCIITCSEIGTRKKRPYRWKMHSHCRESTYSNAKPSSKLASPKPSLRRAEIS